MNRWDARRSASEGVNEAWRLVCGVWLTASNARPRSLNSRSASRASWPACVASSSRPSSVSQR
ncbi:hypothetical protein AK51_04660 [Serratia nematodiphila DZ0503SBS1]|nr:hypothetical protein AK51_04660 [Serratia nematodiphila DZ0503SBS1]